MWRVGSMLLTWPCRQLVTSRQELRSDLLQIASTGLHLLCALCFGYVVLSCPLFTLIMIPAVIHCLVLPGMSGWRMASSADALSCNWLAAGLWLLSGWQSRSCHAAQRQRTGYQSPTRCAAHCSLVNCLRALVD